MNNSSFFFFSIPISLLLRFTDDTFDPELAATIGKYVLMLPEKNLHQLQNKIAVCLDLSNR